MTKLQTNFKGGIQNWINIFFINLFLYYLISNYFKRGIIYTPAEYIYFLTNFLYRTKLVYASLLTGFFLQLTAAIFLEKLLLKQILTESIGRVLQVINATLILNLIAFNSIYYNFNSFAAAYLTGINFVFVLKFWSYAAVNKYYRLKYLKNKTRMHKLTSPLKNRVVTYPENLKIQSLVKFIIGRGNLIYTLEEPHKVSRRYLKILKIIFISVMVKLLLVLIMYQFIIPGLDETIAFIDNREHLKAFQSILEIMIPIYGFAMLMIYYFTFILYLPLLTEIWGFECQPYMKDWWNSESMGKLWKKWNVQTHYFFKQHITKPMYEKGYNRISVNFAVFLISGLLHEYLVGFAFKTCYGVATIGLFLQPLICYLTFWIQKKYGDNIGNITTLGILQLFKVIVVIYVYYCYFHKYY